jgi:glycosyltransferase involved in cell wall biosynthesis
MKILLVSELDPGFHRGGAYIRIRNLVKLLAEAHDVALLTGSDSRADAADFFDGKWDRLPEMRKRGKGMHLFRDGCYLRPNRQYLSAIENAAREHGADLIFFDYMYWGHYVGALRRAGWTCWMDTHNAQSSLLWQRIVKYKSVGLLPTWFFRVLQERFLFRRFERVFCVSESDAEFHRRFMPSDRVVLLPNFINLSDFKEVRAQREQKPEKEAIDVIVAGGYQTFQNRLGVEWLLDQVWPAVHQKCPLARLTIAGSAADQYFKSDVAAGIRVVSDPPKMEPYFEEADVSLVPILHGSGTRFKVLESLASKLPLVGTTVGVEGIAVRDQKHCYVADTPEAFSDAIIALIADASIRCQMAEVGFELVAANYSELTAKQILKRELERVEQS